MSRPRRKMFGPLFYTTVVISVLVTILAEFTIHEPAITAYLTERSLRQQEQALIAELQSDIPKVRQMALDALVRNRSKAVVPYLLEAARDSHSELRILAFRHLTELDVARDVMVPVLIAAASDPDELIRFEAALAFGRIRSQRMSLGAAVPTITYGDGMTPDLRARSIIALRALLKDTASPTRVAAADALEKLGADEEAAAALVAATGDSDRDLRFAAARALLKINGANDSTAGRTLVALIGSRDQIGDRLSILQAVNSASPDVQNRAIAVLSSLLGEADLLIHPDVVDCLVAAGPRARPALPALERLLNGKTPEERGIAAIAIARIEGTTSPRTLPELLRSMEDLAVPLDRRHRILEWIRELNAPDLAKVTPILIRQLGSKNPQVRTDALEMLGSIVGDFPAEMPAPTGGK